MGEAMKLKEPILELIRKASTGLSEDVENAIICARDKEQDQSTAQNVLNTILENIKLAREKSTPICQDTGALLFYIDYPVNGAEAEYRDAINWAAEKATQLQYLRPNAVNPITGKNSGNNIGLNAPYIHFNQWGKNSTRIRLMLKGGGSENVGTQYKLPNTALKAGRDLGGVRKVAIDAVLKAQGQGCAPGIIGVGIGGDRMTSYALSKEQFFRNLDQKNPDIELQKLEETLYTDLNKLGIGPMGLGGATTTLGVYIGWQHRHPATYYVSISYMCWAYRKKTLTLQNGEVLYD